MVHAMVVHSTVVHVTVAHATMVHAMVAHSTVVHAMVVHPTMVHVTVVHVTVVHATMVHVTVVHVTVVHVTVVHVTVVHPTVVHVTVGERSKLIRRGIIKLIPKKDAEPYFVKNWRPITLLKCDYKIAAKAIANRLKNVLPKLINSDQTCFLKGRFIGENIRLVDGILNHTATQNIPGVLLFLDFEKAFDAVE